MANFTYIYIYNVLFYLFLLNQMTLSLFRRLNVSWFWYYYVLEFYRTEIADIFWDETAKSMFDLSRAINIFKTLRSYAGCSYRSSLGFNATSRRDMVLRSSFSGPTRTGNIKPTDRQKTKTKTNKRKTHFTRVSSVRAHA